MIISAMNKKNYIIILVFSLLSLSIIVFFIWPYFIEIRARSEELVLEKDQVSSLNIKINELDNFEKEYDNYLPNLQKIEQMFVDPQDPIDFIEFIEDVASDSKIILQVSPQFSSENYSVSRSWKKMIWSLGEHAFSVILALILIDIIISALIIYVYIVLPQ